MNTKATLSDWVRRRNEIRQVFPDDLLEDLKDSEPELYTEAQICDQNIVHFKKELQASVSPNALLPSLLTNSWDRKKRNRFSKNWPDMENLLKLYAIGLYFKDQPLTLQAEHDKQELSAAIQKASISAKHTTGIPAERRLANAKTYLRFGMNTLEAFFEPDSIQRDYEMAVLDAEIYETTNNFNAEKLIKSKNMALRVGRMICNRYKSK